MALNLPSSSVFNLGHYSSGNSSFSGEIAEVVVYNRNLSSKERKAVEAYLSQRWMEDTYPKSCQEIYLADNNALDGTYT